MSSLSLPWSWPKSSPAASAMAASMAAATAASAHCEQPLSHIGVSLYSAPAGLSPSQLSLYFV